MQKIKCPKCGEEFTIDENSYAELLNQVKGKEFDKELKNREEMLISKLEAQKESELIKVKSQIETLKAEKKILEEKQKAQMEAEVSKVNQENSTKLAKLEKEIEVLKAEKQTMELTKKQELADQANKSKLALVEKESELNSKIQKIQAELSSANKDAELKVAKAVQIKQEMINKLQADIKSKEELVAYYKDLKTKMSTKLVGETLEQHCMNQFNQIRTTAFPKAYFEKDNKVSKESGSKGDFIFRDFDGDKEYISIMFEMKNDSDTTATRHKNEHFFKELDKDRTEKNCEYAVLVSMLEPENDFYNSGIVDVSYTGYKKMYVIRPQCFLTIISLLVNAAKNSIDYQRQLEVAKNQNLDITNFEDKIKNWKDDFIKHLTWAGNKHIEAVKYLKSIRDNIDKCIESLEVSNKHLSTSTGDLEDLTIRKLTYKNPTMKQKFEEAKKNKEQENKGK